MKKRVVVAMSGGVDSSVAAALLQKQGHEVIGITMCFNLADSSRKRPSCCGWQGIEDARRVAHKLGIKHYVLNFQRALEEKVIKDFCKEYLCGRTPNPCVRCNQFLKFDALLKKARSFETDILATGHYARIVKTKENRYLLKKARDLKKDQSYFLYRVNQEQLARLFFPLGGYTKEEVRKLAREFDLSVADKSASQEICFLPEDDYRSFLITRIKSAIKPGLVEDKEGNILGEHKGIPFYTIGQREGLGIAKGYPLYITEIRTKDNKIIVGKKEEVYKSKFLVEDLHFIIRPLKKKVAVGVRIRYNHQEAPAEVAISGSSAGVRFQKAQFAITPGQSAVFFKGNTVLGGGIIRKVIN